MNMANTPVDNGGGHGAGSATAGQRIKVVYVCHFQLTTRWLQNFCLDELAGTFDIEYWDCSSITKPSFKSRDVLSRPYVTVIDSLAELAQRLRTLPANALRVIDIERNKHNLPIHKTLAAQSDLCINVNCFGAGLVMRAKVTVGSVARKIMQRRVAGYVYDKINRRMTAAKYKGLYKEYSITSLRSSPSPYRINHPDYDRYLRSLSHTKPYRAGRYVVYIDNYFPYHQEILKREPRLNPAQSGPKFYSSLNNFFDRIEKQMDCRVIIACHPLSSGHDDRFGQRERVYDKTAELVKDSIGVCVHTSNAFSYIVLYDKPVALLWNAVYARAKSEFARLRAEAGRLGLPLVNTDCELPAAPTGVFTRIRSDIADRYKKEYLIASAGKSNASLYERCFRQIYDEWNKATEYGASRKDADSCDPHI